MASRRSFVVLTGLGLSGSGLAALAGSRAWVLPHGNGDVPDQALSAATASAGDGSAPLTTAVALVVLAAWGVVLVTRGRFRLAIAWLTAVASLALLAVSVAGFVAAPDDPNLAGLLELYGVPDAAIERTLWPWLAVAGATVATLAAGLGLRRVGSWPEMGRRYDAPTSGAVGTRVAASASPDATGPEATAEPAKSQDPADADPIDLWKAMDEGRDPTA